MNWKKPLIISGIIVGTAGLFGTGVYFSDEIKETYLIVKSWFTPAAKEDGSFPFPELKVANSEEQGITANQQSQAASPDLQNQVRNLALPPRSKEDLYQSLDQSVTSYCGVVIEQYRQQQIEELVDKAEQQLEQSFSPETQLRRSYRRTLTDLDKYAPQQLAALEKEIQEISRKQLSPEERARLEREEILAYLGALDRKELLELGKEVSQRFLPDGYELILKTHDLDFWLEKLNKTYGVNFRK